MQSVRGGAAPRHVIRLKGEKRKSLLILSVYNHLSVVQSTNIECFPMITWKITFKLERKKLDYLFIKKVGKSIKAQKSTFGDLKVCPTFQMTDNNSKVMRRTDSSSKSEANSEEDRCSVGCFTVQSRTCQVEGFPPTDCPTQICCRRKRLPSPEDTAIMLVQRAGR